MTWLPIETAPKDGTEILAVEGDSVAVVHWNEHSGDNGEWRDWGDLGAAGAHPFEPSHWMPLPELPTGAKE